ncbi:hypothetical protein P7D93_19055 [Enterococcus raffinosus]|uniref:hypothetical protein n=1 Tax=Enterococcus raffinosus TaxID=71452 RepID=UPI00289201FE|nr:hypothetical protein [Enterococcus raffinosus]MDT2531962.1 hypothetical protein [Enterococcus raffinosus]
MSVNVREFGEAINETRLAMEEGKLVIIDKYGKRKEHHIDSEVYGRPGFFDVLIWHENGKKQDINVSEVKSVNGIQKSNFE